MKFGVRSLTKLSFPLFHSHGCLLEELSLVGNGAFRACWHFHLMLYRCFAFEERLMLFLRADFTTFIFSLQLYYWKPDFKYVGILKLECCKIATMGLFVTTKSDS